MSQNNLTQKQLDQKILELQHLIQDNTALWFNDNTEKQLKRKKKAAEDPFFFAKEYFPHYIQKEFGKIHKEWYELSNKTDAVVAVVGPHEHGKTVELAIWIPIYKILMNQIRFPVFIGHDQKMSSERTEAILMEFQFNKRLQHDFGYLLRADSPDPKDFTLTNGTRILAIGYKQVIRGKMTRSQRPDYIVIDDFEDEKSHNRRIAKEKLNWVLGDVYGSIETHNCVVIWLANLTNKESAINYFKDECEEKPSKFKIFKLYRAIKEDGTPLWPEGFTAEDLELKKEVIGSIRFNRHWQMNPQIEGEIFKSFWFRYFGTTDKKPAGKTITWVDPSLGQKKSDFQAILTVERAEAEYRVWDAWIRRESILDMLRYLYHLDDKFETMICMEVNFWQVLLLDYIDQIVDEFGYILPVFGVYSKSNKQEDIMKLQPLFQRGKILFPEEKNGDVILLEEMLGGFDPELSAGNRIKDDGPDVLARVIKHFKESAHKREYKSARTKTLNSNNLKKLW